MADLGVVENGLEHGRVGHRRTRHMEDPSRNLQLVCRAHGAGAGSVVGATTACARASTGGDPGARSKLAIQPEGQGL